MASYVVPQVEVHQLFSEIPVALAQNQIPFVFGANYQLHRYENGSEKDNSYIGVYDSAIYSVSSNPFTSEYPGALNPDKIDKSYTKMFCDNVLVQVYSFASTEISQVSGSENKLDLTVPTNFPDANIEGFYLRLSYTSESSTTYSDVRITSVDYASSTDTKLRVVIDEEFGTLSDLSAVLCEPQNGVQIYREKIDDPNKVMFNWEQTEDSEKNPIVKIILDNVTTRISNIRFRAASSTGYGKIVKASMYLTFRELLNSYSDTIHSVTGAEEVSTYLGTVHPDNPLAQSVYNAALNAGGQTVRYMAVTEDSIEGYKDVLKAASLTKDVYFMVPATRDGDVLTLVKSHVNTMSEATTKRWRIAFVSAEVPEGITVYGRLNNTDLSDFYARVLEYDAIKDRTVVQFMDPDASGTNWTPSSRTLFKDDVSENDTLYINFDKKEWDVTTPDAFAVVNVVNNNTLRVQGHVVLEDPTESSPTESSPTESSPNEDEDTNRAGMLNDTTVVKKAEIYHGYSNAEKAEAIRDCSSQFASRRIYNVFPSQFSANGVEQSGEFAAACVAGLVSSCLPQQPVTNLALTGITDVPMVYRTFSYEELNTMASGGTFIVMQDLPGDEVYIRHQISTAYEDNNLNTAELSVTKNLDSISYYFDNLCSPYIGKYNITPELLTVLRSVITTGLTSLSSTNYGLYGPQIIADGTEILLLEQDAVLKDHVNCNIKLNIPYPFNHLVLKLFV